MPPGICLSGELAIPLHALSAPGLAPGQEALQDADQGPHTNWCKSFFISR